MLTGIMLCIKLETKSQLKHVQVSLAIASRLVTDNERIDYEEYTFEINPLVNDYSYFSLYQKWG